MSCAQQLHSKNSVCIGKRTQYLVDSMVGGARKKVAMTKSTKIKFDAEKNAAKSWMMLNLPQV